MQNLAVNQSLMIDTFNSVAVHEMYFGVLVQLGLVSRVVWTSGIFISVSGLFWRMAIWHVAFIEAVWHVAVGVAVINRVSCTSAVDLKLKSIFNCDLARLLRHYVFCSNVIIPNVVIPKKS